MGCVTQFLRRAEEILDVASAERQCQEQETAIVIDRQGGMRMLDPTGWSMPGLLAEFGAAVVYRVKKSRGAIRVEGWDGMQRCELQRPANSGVYRDTFAQPAMVRMSRALAPAIG